MVGVELVLHGYCVEGFVFAGAHERLTVVA